MSRSRTATSIVAVRGGDARFRKSSSSLCMKAVRHPSGNTVSAPDWAPAAGRTRSGNNPHNTVLNFVRLLRQEYRVVIVALLSECVPRASPVALGKVILRIRPPPRSLECSQFAEGLLHVFQTALLAIVNGLVPWTSMENSDRRTHIRTVTPLVRVRQ